MKKSWKLTDKILTGKKTIESRWYKSRNAPWDKIRAGETVYFKDSGKPVSVKAEVAKVVQFSDLNPDQVKAILYEYGREGGIEGARMGEFYEVFKDKKYCVLVFLKNPQKITPFKINKRGFGVMSPWLCVEDIDSIKIKC